MVFCDPLSKRKHGALYGIWCGKSVHTHSARTYISISFGVGNGKKKPSSEQIYLKLKFFSNLWWVRVILHDRFSLRIFPLIDGIQNLCRYVRYLPALVKIYEQFFSLSSIFVWNAKTESDSISISNERNCRNYNSSVFFRRRLLLHHLIALYQSHVMFSVCDGKFMKNAIKIVTFRSDRWRWPEHGEYDSVRNQNRNDFNWNERTPKVERKKIANQNVWSNKSFN